LRERPRRLSLAKYRNLVGGLDRPSDVQCEAFTRYVSSAHSWYKHLPLVPPGARFTFFLDLFAGCDVMETKDSRTLLVPRESQGFHYSALPTLEYRTHLGYLGYAHQGGTHVKMTSGDGFVSLSDHLWVIADQKGRWWHLPREVTDVGSVDLTAFVHPTVPLLLGSIPLDRDLIPPESGVRATSAGRRAHAGASTRSPLRAALPQ
jgi:hypothetical protein